MKSVDEKIAFISHELRSPITSIIEILQDMDQEKDIDVIKHEICKLTQMSNQMLDNINQVLNSKRDINESVNTQFALHSMFKNVENLCVPLANQKNQKLVFDYSKCMNRIVQGNETKIKCICNNILTNSIKYTDYYGEIRLSLDEEIDEGTFYLVVTINDNGIGMDKELLHNVFHNKYICKDKSKGTGLGLFITKKIVDSINGDISCESVVGKGSKFVIKIPLKIICNYNLSSIKDKNVLLIDDDKCIFSIYKHFLERMGLKVLTCNNMKEMQYILKNASIDLVIVDYRLDESGFGDYCLGNVLAKKIKGLCKNCRIMIISSNRRNEVFPKGLPKYINDYMTKPINYEKAEEHIMSLLVNK